jgi:hypothetical protein
MLLESFDVSKIHGKDPSATTPLDYSTPTTLKILISCCTQNGINYIFKELK